MAGEKEKGEKGPRESGRGREEGDKALDEARMFFLTSDRAALKMNMSRNRER